MVHLVLEDYSSSDLLRRTQNTQTNMKSFIVFAAIVAVAVAAVPRRRLAAPRSLSARPIHVVEQRVAASNDAPAVLPSPKQIVLIKEIPSDVPHLHQHSRDIQLIGEIPSDNIGLDSYRFAFEQSDGQKREETAKVQVASDPEESILRVQGSYSYVGDDGQTYTVTYIADENGFQPQGAHLPVAPVA